MVSDDEKWNDAIKRMKYLVGKTLKDFQDNPNRPLTGFEMELDGRVIQVVISDKNVDDISKRLIGDSDEC